jgi:DNA translocase FtsK/SpoIIIE-like protein
VEGSLNLLAQAPARRTGGALAAAALAAVGLSGFQGVGLAYHRLFRPGTEFDRNFLTLSLVRVEEALGLFPSLLLAGLVLQWGVSTFVRGALKGPAARSAGIAGAVLFAASFLAIAEGPAHGGWIGARTSAGIAALIGTWGAAALFVSAGLLALHLATDGFFAPSGAGRSPAPAIEGFGEIVKRMQPGRPLPAPAPLSPEAAQAEGGGGTEREDVPSNAPVRPKSGVADGRYGSADPTAGETGTGVPATEEGVEAQADAGIEARAERGDPEPDPAPGAGGSDRAVPDGSPADRSPPADPDDGDAGGSGPLVDVARGGASSREAAGSDPDPPDAPSGAGPPVEPDPAPGGDPREEGSAILRPAALRRGRGSRPASDEGGLLVSAAEAIFEAERASVSVLQGRLGVPFVRASRLLERLEREGLVGPYRGGSARDILLTRSEWEKRPRGG